MVAHSTWLLLALLCLTPIFSPVRCDDDDLTDEEQGSVDDEGDLSAKETTVESTIGPSPDAEVLLLFTKPPRTKLLPAGSIVKFLVSFFNKGDNTMTVTDMDASFRYPQDYNFFIQNYTAAKYNRVVEGGQETTLDYAFVASETYAGRPLGLTVNVRYKDGAGKAFQNAVFNATVTIVDDESAFNAEAGFLYMVFAAIVVLLMLLGRQLMGKMRKRHGMGSGPAAKPVVETGTKGDVDFEWIPRQVQEIANKSPGRSPPSARQRRAQKSD